MAKPESPRRNLTGAIVPALGVAGLAAAFALLIVGQGGVDKNGTPPAPQNCILEHADAVGGPIDLVNSRGARVSEADFAGEPAVIYFGFTHCPDVCPTSLFAIAEALALPGGSDVRSILVSVDPERDTPASMASYVATEGFPPELIGLTGTRAQVDAARAAFQVYASRTPIPNGEAGEYSVDHSSLLYVVDGQWRTVAIVPTMRRADENDPRSPLVATSPADIAACITAGLQSAR